jgi:hypothetical protein
MRIKRPEVVHCQELDQECENVEETHEKPLTILFAILKERMFIEVKTFSNRYTAPMRKDSRISQAECEFRLSLSHLSRFHVKHSP